MRILPLKRQHPTHSGRLMLRAANCLQSYFMILLSGRIIQAMLE